MGFDLIATSDAKELSGASAQFHQVRELRARQPNSAPASIPAIGEDVRVDRLKIETA